MIWEHHKQVLDSIENNLKIARHMYDSAKEELKGLIIRSRKIDEDLKGLGRKLEERFGQSSNLKDSTINFECFKFSVPGGKKR